YNTSDKIYTCPGQKDIYALSRGKLLPMEPARSFSISGQMNGLARDSSGKPVPIMLGGNPSTAPSYSKLSAINRPPPAKAFVFADESQYTIDDGYFAVQVNND